MGGEGDIEEEPKGIQRLEEKGREVEDLKAKLDEVFTSQEAVKVSSPGPRERTIL